MRCGLLATIPLICLACSNLACSNEAPREPPPSDPPAMQPPPRPIGGEDEACERLGLPVRSFDDAGPFALKRNALAEDFTVVHDDGTSWTLSERWSGCESYLFVPSGRINSGLDSTSIWARDLDVLVATSPRNAHYFFVTTRTPEEAVAERDAMRARIDGVLAALPAEDASWWRSRLHLVRDHRDALDGLAGEMLRGIGAGGFAVDRQQRLRLLGSFADVTRYKPALQSQGHWPWEANMAYAAYEARHYDYEATREAYLSSHQAMLVRPWAAQVLGGEVQATATFPDAETMAGFDTLEIDLTMDCSDPLGGEFGNCGEWDYLSHIHLLDEDGTTWIELARFITTYHRQGRYLVDATPMLAHLWKGGPRTVRFVVSPPWNPQAYRTWMQFRLSNQRRGVKPIAATPLFSGGDFNPSYNDAQSPIDVPIPSRAKRVVLWSIITGHGGATANCAEFCNHEHELTIDGQSYLKTHAEVGDDEGCVAQVDHGMVPNQGGTWWFGRGGWCPGQQVEPWLLDVTADVTPGTAATVSYRATFNGQTPPDNAGNIVMSSWLVAYE